MNIPQNAIDLCTTFEGFFSKPYLCPARVPTIGYGTTRYPNGQAVTLKDQAITKDRAIEFMKVELSRNMFEVARTCPILLTTDEYWYGAIIDFVYNLGIGRLQTSTLRRRINAQLWQDVPFELNKWVYASGKKLNGLNIRRRAEAAYYTPYPTRKSF